MLTKKKFTLYLYDRLLRPFRLDSTYTYPRLVLRVNPDNSATEYAYPSFPGTTLHGSQDTLRANGWVQADMAKELKPLENSV